MVILNKTPEPRLCSPFQLETRIEKCKDKYLCLKSQQRKGHNLSLFFSLTGTFFINVMKLISIENRDFILVMLLGELTLILHTLKKNKSRNRQ